MLLQNSQGQTSSRMLRVKTLEMPVGGHRILFVFDEPRDVKGTVLLILRTGIDRVASGSICPH